MLQPLYNLAVKGLVDKVTNGLESLTESGNLLEGRTGLTSVLQDFITEVQAMPTADLVEIINSLDLDEIFSDGSGDEVFNNDALASIFEV